MKQKLGIAVAGIGEYASDQIIPSLKQTKHCFLAGIVSGSEAKRQKYKKDFNLGDDSLFDYENFDAIIHNRDIDIVYITLPNSLHAEYTIRAARAGKHVICEKPMAMNVNECFQMMDAVQNAGVRFSMGYRLHFDPFNKEMMRLGQHGIFGEVKRLTLLDSMKIGDPNVWRLDSSRAGGGPLMNNGVYCIQAAIYIKGRLPVAVEAKFSPVSDQQKFGEVEEGIEWKMFFDDGCIAYCESSYSKDQNTMRADAERGWFELNPAYEYDGLKGKTSEGNMDFKPIKQQALQMDDFAECIKNNRETPVPAEMGLRDMEIIEAIYESARTKRKIELHLEEFENLTEY